MSKLYYRLHRFYCRFRRAWREARHPETRTPIGIEENFIREVYFGTPIADEWLVRYNDNRARDGLPPFTPNPDFDPNKFAHDNYQDYQRRQRALWNKKP